MNPTRDKPVSPLLGMKRRRLHGIGAGVNDLTPLNGMPPSVCLQFAIAPGGTETATAQIGGGKVTRTVSGK